MVAFTTRPPETSLDRFASLLVRLHSLIAEELGDEAEADEIRDLMEMPWQGLNETDAGIARQLSADLYTLTSTISPAHPSGDFISPSLAYDLNKAKVKGDFLTALSLVNFRFAEIGAYRAANLRGSSYVHLGLSDVAILFFERAVELSSTPTGALIFLLTTLADTGKLQLAAKHAREILRKGTSDVELHRLSALILLSEAREIEQSDVQSQVLEAKDELDKVLTKLQSISLKDHRTAESILECHFSLAECHYLLGNEKLALQQLETALTTAPNYEPALVFRGLLNIARDFPLSRKDFQDAVKAGTRDALPYYYLAYDAILSEDFRACLDLASEGIRKARKPEMVAEFHEMIAISLFKLNSDDSQIPTNEIRKHFSLAVAQSPLSISALNNSRHFEDFVTRRVPPAWNVQKPSSPTTPEITREWQSRYPSHAMLVG